MNGVKILPNGMVQLPDGSVVSKEAFERILQGYEPIGGTPVGTERPVGPPVPTTTSPASPQKPLDYMPTMTRPSRYDLLERNPNGMGGRIPPAAPTPEAMPERPTGQRYDMNRLQGRDLSADRPPKSPEAEGRGLLDILLSANQKEEKPGFDWRMAGAGLLSMSPSEGMQRMGAMGMEQAGALRKEERALKRSNRTVDALVASGMITPEQADALRSNPELIKTVYEQALKGNTPLSPAGKLASDLKNGLITPEQYNAEVERLKKSGVTVENIIGGDTYTDEVNRDLAGEFGDLVRQGTAAAKSLQEVAQLEQFLTNAPQGGAGAFVQFASNLGIKLEGASEIEAATAIINRLVPAQRPIGSGPMSDADLALFRQSLPRIINSPQGNQLIIQTLKAIATYDMKMAQIANKARMDPKNYGPQQAYADMQQLTNPLGWLRDSPMAAPPPAGPTGTPVRPASIPQDVWDSMTPAERGLFPGA